MVFRRPVLHASTFLRSLRSTPVTALRRYYGRSDFWTALHRRPDLPASRTRPSDHSVSNHRWSPAVAFARYPSARQASRVPSSDRCPEDDRCGSGLRHWLAGSSGPRGRIEFVILRTDRSSPVALHLASRPRSYVRLQAGERLPGRDFHPSVSCTLAGALAGGVSPRCGVCYENQVP